MACLEPGYFFSSKSNQRYIRAMSTLYQPYGENFYHSFKIALI